MYSEIQQLMTQIGDKEQPKNGTPRFTKHAAEVSAKVEQIRLKKLSLQKLIEQYEQNID